MAGSGLGVRYYVIDFNQMRAFGLEIWGPSIQDLVGAFFIRIIRARFLRTGSSLPGWNRSRADEEVVWMTVIFSLCLD